MATSHYLLNADDVAVLRRLVERYNAMTEAEWLASTDPQRMLRWVGDPGKPDGYHVASDRKLRLWACACCRVVWQLLTDERSRRAVEVAERFADGEATQHELDSATWSQPEESARAMQTWAYVLSFINAGDCAATVLHNQRVAGVGHPATQASLLRDIVGNPCRPVAHSDGVPAGTRMAQVGPHVFPDTWRTDTVVRVARQIYAARAFDLMPILADALEDAGCEDKDILSHCRGLERCGTCLGNGSVDVPYGDGTLTIPCQSYEPIMRPGKESHLQQMTREAHDQAAQDAQRILDVRGKQRCGGTGLVPRIAPCVRGCWLIDMLLEKE